MITVHVAILGQARKMLSTLGEPCTRRLGNVDMQSLTVEFSCVQNLPMKFAASSHSIMAGFVGVCSLCELLGEKMTSLRGTSLYGAD